MEIVEKKYDEVFYQSNILSLYLEGCRLAIIDIETTGLHAEKNKVIIGGILIIEPTGFTVKQYFAESKSEEDRLLNYFYKDLKDIDVLINYNGSSFDIPFLNKRMAYHKIPYSIPAYQSLDLYKIIKNTHYELGLHDFKQKTVENFLGIQRSDQITGKQSVDLYKQFLETNDPEIKTIILNHNLDDLHCLAKVMKILSKFDLHKIMFESGFQVKKSGKKIAIEKIKSDKNNIYAEGKILGSSIPYTSYAAGYNAVTSLDSSELFIQIPFIKQNSIMFIDLTDFDFDLGRLYEYPNVQNDLLIIKKDKAVSYVEINLLIKHLCLHLLQSI